MNAKNQNTTNISKGLNIALWVVQGLLFAGFAMAGFMKTFTPYAELAQQMAWVGRTPEMLVRFIGIAELAGAFGLILPAATRIKPILTPITASALVVVMVLAIGEHLLAAELKESIPALVMGSMAAFVAWGRFKHYR